MDLQLVKMSEKFKPQLLDMMDEWTKTGETIIPWAIRKVDYHDFDAYLKSLEESEPKEGYVPASTFFAYDRERDILVGAVDIRHSLNEALLLDGGQYRRRCASFGTKERICNSGDRISVRRVQKAGN